MTIAPKRMRYLGIHLTKEVKDPHSKNYRTRLKETEEDTERWKTIPALGLEEFMYWENVHVTQGNLHMEGNPYRNTMDFLQRVGTNHLKISVESEKTPSSRGI